MVNLFDDFTIDSACCVSTREGAVCCEGRGPVTGMLSQLGAQRLQLAAQGLLQPSQRRARPADVVRMIERMRLLQIDTIQVVARSPLLVLHSRLGDFPAAWLVQLLAEGRIAECWAHEACFVPASDIGWHRHALAQRQHHWAHRHAVRLRCEDAPQMAALLRKVEAIGPVRAADFARQPGTPTPRSGWWEWKPEKRWLEAWFALGELMVRRRDGFQRVYDLTPRVLNRLDPPLDPAVAKASAEQLRQHFILDSVKALGIAPAAWIADYHRLKPAVTERELAPLLDDGRLLSVAVAGWKSPAYVHHEQADLLEKARQGRLRATHTTVLSPFDPLVWDRARVRAMFNFDYTLECYTPAAKRRYGYFVLPLLHRGRLIGRLDAKAHRREGLFEIRQLFLEAGVVVTESLIAAIAASLGRTAAWHQTPQVRLRSAQPASLLKPLRSLWRQSE